MTEDNPPIAHPESASLGNQLPLLNNTTNQHQELAATGTVTETIVDNNDNDNDSNNNTVHAMEGDNNHDATTTPTTSGHKNLSFANNKQDSHDHVHAHHHQDLDQVEEIPTVLTGVAPSTAEGYSIYSNIKDGKVPFLSTPLKISSPPPRSRSSFKWSVQTNQCSCSVGACFVINKHIVFIRFVPSSKTNRPVSSTRSRSTVRTTALATYVVIQNFFLWPWGIYRVSCIFAAHDQRY